MLRVAQLARQSEEWHPDPLVLPGSRAFYAHTGLLPKP